MQETYSISNGFMLTASLLKKWGEVCPERIAQFLLVTGDVCKLIAY